MYTRIENDLFKTKHLRQLVNSVSDKLYIPFDRRFSHFTTFYLSALDFGGDNQFDTHIHTHIH